MSGSGSSVFALTASADAAKPCAARFLAEFGEHPLFDSIFRHARLSG